MQESALIRRRTAMTGMGPEPATAFLRLLRWASIGSVAITSVVLAITIADHLWQLLACLVAAGMAWGTYFRAFRKRDASLLPPLALVVCLLLFVTLSENLLTLEPALGLRVSNRLVLSSRLARYANEHTALRDDSFEQFGPDPLFYRRTPGTLHRSFYDADQRRPHEAVVDEVGYLNPPGFYSSRKSIDIFVGGDSVTQGVGSPGVTELLKSRVSMTVFNLSVAHYGPRQQTEALATFGVPKSPAWLVVAFNGGNDAYEIVKDDLCERRGRDFHCRWDQAFIARTLGEDAASRSFIMGGTGASIIRRLAEVRSDSMSLALGTLLARGAKETVRRALLTDRQTTDTSQLDQKIVPPGHTDIPQVDWRKRREWVEMGLRLTVAAYDRLDARVRGTDVGVMVLYVPTSYEVYRDLLPVAVRDPESEVISTLQRKRLDDYTHRAGWAFCDLTDGLRRSADRGERALFGSRDGWHWSPKGTAMAATLIAECLDSFARR